MSGPVPGPAVPEGGPVPGPAIPQGGPVPGPAIPEGGPATVLALEGLAIRAGGRVLARHLDLTVGEGERVAVVGPSGAGKTTLLRAVAGLSDPAAGRVLLRGRSAADLGWPAWRRRVVYVAQQPAFTDAAVHEVLARPFAFRSAPGAFPEDRARALLARTGLGEGVWNQAVRTLSVGQQQRVSLLRALLLDPDCLLLDEPTSGLDAASRDAAEALVREAAPAALVVTHDREQAARLCQRTVDLAGHLVADGDDGDADA